MLRFSTLLRWLVTPLATPGWALLLVSLLSTVDAVGSIAERVQGGNMSPWLEADFLLAMAGMGWFAGVLIFVSRRPRRIRTVEMYAIHKDMEALGGGLDRDCLEADEVWVAFESGDYYSSQLADAARPKITRMVLVHPASAHVEYLSAYSGRPIEEIRDQIRRTTKIAQEMDEPVAVRWSRAPLLNCVVGRKRGIVGRTSTTRFVRFQVFCPHSWTKNWPNFRVTSRQDGDTVQRIEAVFEDMWAKSDSPDDAPEAPRVIARTTTTNEQGYESDALLVEVSGTFQTMPPFGHSLPSLETVQRWQTEVRKASLKPQASGGLVPNSDIMFRYTAAYQGMRPFLSGDTLHEMERPRPGIIIDIVFDPERIRRLLLRDIAAVEEAVRQLAPPSEAPDHPESESEGP